jgi:hypothetical protein
MIAVFLLIASLALPPASRNWETPRSRSRQGGTGATRGAEQAPSAAELRALLERMIAAMHRSDAEDLLTARTEHWSEPARSGATGDAQLIVDRVYRVYPTGTGTLKLVVEERGAPVAPEQYREELRELEQTLEWALDPDEPKQRERVEKFQKRSAARRRAVDAFRDSYELSWLGRETLEGRSAEKLLLDPKPGTGGGSVATELLAASRLTLWVDGETGGVIQLNAELVRDLLFGGGLLGKIEKGGRVHIEQTQIAPGIWLPKLTRYEVQGRKLFTREKSDRTIEASGFRRVGPPAELLPLVRRELSNAQLQVPAP